MPGAIIFDLYNTLVRDLPDERVGNLREIAADFEVDPDAFIERFHAMYRGRITGMPSTFEEQLANAADSPSTVSADSVSRAVRRRLEFNRRVLVVAETRLRFLAELRSRGWLLGLLSNLSADSADVLRNTPLAAAFDFMALSCELRMAKPDEAIYRAAADGLGVDPSACLFVGDGADRELRGARSAGMLPIQTREYAMSDASWDGLLVHSLEDVAKHVPSASIG